MSPRQLEYFLEIYNQKSIKKAAEKLIISPQAVSKTIKEIEEELGVKLFLRGKKSLEPTAEAEYLKNHALKILDEYEKINSIKKFNTSKRKVLTLYSIDGFLQYVTVKFIEDFQIAFPDILLNIIETTERDILDKLDQRIIDISNSLQHRQITTFLLLFIYTVIKIALLFIKITHYKKDEIFEYDLDNQPIAGKGYEYSCYSSNIKRLFQKNINPQIKLETTNDSLIIQMASKNLAIGITLDFIAFNANAINIVIKPINGVSNRNTFWVENNYAILTKEQQIFRDFLLKWIDYNRSELFNWDFDTK